MQLAHITIWAAKQS